jgi:hypothetical protein
VITQQVLDLVQLEGEQIACALRPSPPCHRLPERPGRPLAANPALSLGVDRSAFDSDLHRRNHALAPPPPSHVLKIRSLLEEHYQPATATRMLAALRGVRRECWHAQLLTTDEYQAATAIPAVGGESEARGRDLSAGEVRRLFEACARAPGEGHRQDSPARRRRDAAFVALAYGCGLRRNQGPPPADARWFGARSCQWSHRAGRRPDSCPARCRRR